MKEEGGKPTSHAWLGQCLSQSLENGEEGGKRARGVAGRAWHIHS